MRYKDTFNMCYKLTIKGLSKTRWPEHGLIIELHPSVNWAKGKFRSEQKMFRHLKNVSEITVKLPKYFF